MNLVTSKIPLLVPGSTPEKYFINMKGIKISKTYNVIYIYIHGLIALNTESGHSSTLPSRVDCIHVMSGDKEELMGVVGRTCPIVVGVASVIGCTCLSGEEEDLLGVVGHTCPSFVVGCMLMSTEELVSVVSCTCPSKRKSCQV